MKKAAQILIVLLVFVSCDLGFNDEQDLSEGCPGFLTVAEQMPQLQWSHEELQSQIIYPDIARRAGIEGRTIVQFIVDKKGRVIEPKIIRGIGAGTDEEAIRVVKLAKFSPGMNNGELVCVQYSLPIVFRLPD